MLSFSEWLFGKNNKTFAINEADITIKVPELRFCRMNTTVNYQCQCNISDRNLDYRAVSEILDKFKEKHESWWKGLSSDIKEQKKSVKRQYINYLRHTYTNYDQIRCFIDKKFKPEQSMTDKDREKYKCLKYKAEMQLFNELKKLVDQVIELHSYNKDEKMKIELGYSIPFYYSKDDLKEENASQHEDKVKGIIVGYAACEKRGYILKPREPQSVPSIMPSGITSSPSGVSSLEIAEPKKEHAFAMWRKNLMEAMDQYF